MAVSSGLVFLTKYRSSSLVFLTRNGTGSRDGGPRHTEINKRNYTQSDAEGCLSREARQKPKESGGKIKDPSLLQSLPNPQANNNKKGTAGVGAGTPSALPASDVEWCVLFFFLIPRDFKINILNVLMRYACLLT